MRRDTLNPGHLVTMFSGKGSLHVTQVVTVPVSLNFLKGQAPYMRDRGLVTTVISSPGKELSTFSEREGTSNVPLSMSRNIDLPTDVQSLFRLVRVFMASRPHIVQAQTPKAGLLGMLAAWITRRPVRIYSILGLKYSTATGRRRTLLQRMEWLSCQFASSIICVSESMRDAAISDKLAKPEKLHVMAGGSVNGIDADHHFNPLYLPTDVRSSTRGSFKIPEVAQVVGYIGRIVNDKGIVELSSAWSALRDNHPNAHLVIVGSEETEDRVAPAVLDSLMSDPRVHLVGSVSDPRPWYASVDVIVLPSYREGFPNVLLEAAAMELPVVATNIPGCIDAVEDGVTATLVPARDAKALGAAIAQYLDDPQLRAMHGKTGRARVLREFRQDVVWEAMYQEYCRLLTERGIPIPTPLPAAVQ